jgi:hypothetical protein
MHDSIREGKGVTPWEVKRFLQAGVSGQAQYETSTLACAAGLTLLLYMLVRHQIGHLWTKVKGLDVTDYFARRLPYHKTLQECLSTEDQEFHRCLEGRKTWSSGSASITPAIPHGQRETSGGAIMTPGPASCAGSPPGGTAPTFAK